MAKRPPPPSGPNPRSRNLGVLIEALRSDVQQVAEGHQQLAVKIDGVRTELKADLHEKFTTLATAMTAIRDELRADVQALRTELHETRDSLRADMQTLRTELHETRDDLRQEIRATREEVRTHTHTP